MSLKSRIEAAYNRMMNDDVKFARLNLTKQQFVAIASCIRAVGLPNIRANYKAGFELDSVDFDALSDIVAVMNGRQIFMADCKTYKYKDNITAIVANL